MNAAKTPISHRRSPLWRHPRVLARRILKSWPLFIWLTAIAFCVYLFIGSSRLSGIQGVVETVAEPVAPLETARLLNLHVAVGNRVAAGDLLATMDTSLFDARAALDESQLIEAESTVQSYQQSILEFVNDFESAIKDAMFELETERQAQQRDQAVLAVLRVELDRLEELRRRNLIGEQELARLRPEIAALEATVAAYPGLIAIHERRLQAALDDRAAMRSLLMAEGQTELDVLSTIRDMREATADVVRLIRERRFLQRQDYELRAHRNGVISAIFHAAGVVVSAGDPVLRLVVEKPERVIGFLPEIYLGDMTPGQKVWVWRQSSDPEPLAGIVQSISPEIQGLPGRVSPIRGQTLRGRRLIVQVTDPHSLVPGESVRVEGQTAGYLARFEAWLHDLSEDER